MFSLYSHYRMSSKTVAINMDWDINDSNIPKVSEYFFLNDPNQLHNPSFNNKKKKEKKCMRAMMMRRLEASR